MKRFIKALYLRIRFRLKHSFDGIRNERIKNNLLQAIPFWIGSLLTGLVAVFYTKVFSWAETITDLIFHTHSWLFFIITPVCFVVAWWLVKKFAPYSKGSGIPQVVAAIELASPKHNDKIRKLLSIPVIIVKIASSLIAAIGGAVIGREGPTIQVAGSIFRKINEWLPSWWPKISKKNMIMTGAAAGLAAAFNTPLGGIVFAIEELTKTHISYFKTAIFTAVIIAGLTAQGFLGTYLYLGYPQVGGLSNWLFLPVIFVALLTGFGGSYMSRVILSLQRWKSKFKFKHHELFYVIGCALVIACLAFFFKASAVGSGKDLMNDALFTSNKYAFWYIPLLRMTGTVVSFTSGIAGGIFAPALSAGASIGSVVSGWFHLSSSDSNVVILCGMVGFLTGVTRSPFTCAILVLEMTDRNNLIFHLMLAGMFSSVIASGVDRHSLYDHLKDQYIHDLIKEDAAESEKELQPVLATE